MRKFSILLSVLVLTAMTLAACGGAGTSTAIPTQNVPPITVEVTGTNAVPTATEASTATEAPTEAPTTGTTETPGIPVTGGANSDRLSKELDYKVLGQDGKQVGKVEDMVLDLSKAKVLYVVVGTGGFLDVGEKKIAVPWSLLKVGNNPASGNASGAQNAFMLQTDTNTFKNAPAIDPKNVPALGAEPDSWDISFRKYWNGGGTTSGNSTPSAAGTVAPDMTATGTSNGTGSATSTPSASESTGTSQGTGTGQGATAITGVQLASKVIGAKLTVGMQSALGTSTPGAAGTSTGATSTPSSGVNATTATPSAGTAATSTPSTTANGKNLSATINDLIVNADAGDIMYIVIKTKFDDGDHLIPVPLSLFNLDSDNQTFILNVDAATLQQAPSFQEDKFPDMTAPGWNGDFDSFWKNNSSGGTSAQATATP